MGDERARGRMARRERRRAENIVQRRMDKGDESV